MKKFIFMSLIMAIALIGCNQTNTQDANEKSQPTTQENNETNETTEEDNTNNFDSIEQIKARGNIVVGTNAAFPPFEYSESDGTVVGFDMELAKKIAEHLGVELKIEDVAFQSLFISLAANKIDFIAAGLTINEDRLKEADFSDIYFNAKQVVLVLDTNNDINSQEDLTDKKIGVQTATTGEDLASEFTDKVTSFNTIALGAVDLQAEKLDALIIDYEPAKAIIEANKDSDKPIKLIDLSFDDEQYAMATSKGNQELIDVINTVLSDLKQSGEYDELMDKYFNN